MLINFDEALIDLDGNEIKTKKDDEEVNYTLRKVCVESLMATYKGEDDLSGEEKVKRYELALAIHATKEPLDLQSENIVLLKKLIAKAFSALVVGQTWKMLENSGN